MKENLIVQFLYPSYNLPEEYYEVIEGVDHVNIKPLDIASDGDLAVCDIDNVSLKSPFTGVLTLHGPFESIIKNRDTVGDIVRKHERCNIIIDNINEFSESDIPDYTDFLHDLSEVILDEIGNGRYAQINILTDRIALNTMNNCNAGVESIAVCPDGKFYICPGFYVERLGSLGEITNPPIIKNQRLYTLKYSPICSHCDAFHCKRCVKLNKQLTREVNTPSRQQCIISHVERTASDKLLNLLQKEYGLLVDIEIPYDNCLDPFENRQTWEE